MKYPLEDYSFDALYLPICEVGSSGRYIMLNLSTGTNMPGMVELHRFRLATDNEW